MKLIYFKEANMKRCCIGCNHKVYSGGGISSSSNIYSSDTGAPSYASNWPNTIQQGTTASEMVVNISSDPIFKESESLQTKDVHGLDKINLRKHDLSIGFNSRPVYFYPEYNYSGKPSLGANTFDTNTQSKLDFKKSEKMIIDPDGYNDSSSNVP